MANIGTPLLIIAFNRPNELSQVVTALSVHRFKKIYAFVDGPRKGHEGEITKVQQCRAILSDISVADEVVNNFKDVNLGCGMGPFTAITDAFQCEDELIIIEDDCVPSLSFPSFCEELLDRYRNDHKVWMISGSNYSPQFKQAKTSYYLSEYCHMGAWSTWKSSWDQVVFDPKSNLDNLSNFTGSSFRTEKERKIFTEVFESNFKNPFYEAWDFQFFFAMAINGGLSVVPKENLITNIGVQGRHQNGADHFNNMRRSENFNIELHPDSLEPLREYDLFHFNNHWSRLLKRPIGKRLINRLKKVLFQKQRKK